MNRIVKAGLMGALVLPVALLLLFYAIGLTFGLILRSDGTTVQESLSSFTSIAWRRFAPGTGFATYSMTVGAIVGVVAALLIKRSKKLFFGVLCSVGCLLSIVAWFFFSYGHSSQGPDLAACILNPLEWICRNFGLWHRINEFGFYGSILGLWASILTGGLLLSRRSIPPFWTLLLAPIATGLSLMLTFVLGWQFGRN